MTHNELLLESSRHASLIRQPRRGLRDWTRAALPDLAYDGSIVLWGRGCAGAHPAPAALILGPTHRRIRSEERDQ